ncbi:AAA family ATPase [Microbacterium sp. p3-SID336]|uniref:AAA family ATPase n=1 Tax=Microbacterium sp. p3-SID336 TaxID=2916212 RepID=UPI0021A5953B|nr:AAA family ATPase [Microbacterium sp. p3-SID336]MCT1479208.1 AAA family ATPase [Microbacterium sp. p3-SID336]
MANGPHGGERTCCPIPASLNGDVRRERLLTRLTAALDEPWTLTLVSAPAGAGKTRLLAQWARDRQAEPDTEVVWVSLEQGEGELPRVRTALEELVDPDLRAAMAAVPSDRSAATIRAFARSLGDARGRIVIIIDDVHRIEDEDVAQRLSTFVQHVPGNVHVVLSGRGTRMIPLARRRITGVALELDSQALAFTPAEVRAFFLARGIRLSQGEISTVIARTEGWAAGLQLTLLAAGGGAVAAHPLRGDDPKLADYFREEVLAELDEGLREFLEATAVVDGFTSELAAVLTGSAHAAPVIDRLLRLNVLSGPDEHEPPRYHYHPLLREFLRGRLRADGDARIDRLEGLAAEWFAARGEHLAALEHAVHSGDQMCMSAILRHCGMQLLLEGRVAEVRTATAQLPATMRSGTAARMLIAATELAHGNASAAAVALPLVLEPGESEAQRRWRVGLALHMALRRGGVVDAVDELDLECRALPGEEQLDTYAFLQAAMGELFAGDLGRAEEFARFAVDLAKATGAGAAELQAQGVLTTSALFRGRMREASNAGAALDRRWRELGQPDNAFFEVTRVWRAWVPYEGMRDRRRCGAGRGGPGARCGR